MPSLPKVAYYICFFALTAMFSACNKDKDSDPETTVHGDSLPMGNGTVRSWAKLDADGNPTSIGVTFSKNALNGLSNPPHMHTDSNPHDFHIEYFKLPVPAQVKDKTPFDHIVVDWNPIGHPPEQYLVPHLDAHFYTIPTEEREQIGDEVSDPKMNAVPDARYLPEDYVDIQVNVPQMGKHWVDKDTPELNGQPFTQTFIYGTYNHKVAFYEPMFTLNYLLSRPDDTFPIKQPADFQQRGLFYPTTYTIRYDSKNEEYIISLNKMKLQ